MNLMEAVYFKRLDTGRRFNDKLAIIILEKVGKGKKKSWTQIALVTYLIYAQR